MTNPNGIWYTPVSGIWQTVWLEPVNNKHIVGITPIANIDNNNLKVKVCTKNTESSDIVEVKLKDNNKVIASAKGVVGQTLDIAIPNAKLWSPESPFLYDLDVTLIERGKSVDKVSSYAAMRKVSKKRDANGIIRIQLNNKDIFHFGPLDQGWWPDGLYTAPTDEALKYDIVKTKRLRIQYDSQTCKSRTSTLVYSLRPFRYTRMARYAEWRSRTSLGYAPLL